MNSNKKIHYLESGTEAHTAPAEEPPKGVSSFNNTTISMLLSDSNKTDVVNLKQIQTRLIQLIKDAGKGGVISSELPKRYEQVFGH